MTMLEIVFWVLGTFGLVGGAALFFFAPVVFWAIIKGLMEFLTILVTYRIGCAILAAALAYFIADSLRHHWDEAEYAERKAAFEQAQTARDKKIESDTRDLVWKEIADATAANTVVDTNAKDFKDGLPPLAVNDRSCRVGADVQKLRSIAGTSGGRSRRPKAVPAPRRRAAGT